MKCPGLKSNCWKKVYSLKKKCQFTEMNISV